VNPSERLNLGSEANSFSSATSFGGKNESTFDLAIGSPAIESYGIATGLLKSDEYLDLIFAKSGSISEALINAPADKRD
jgi:hypothetical protein